MPDVMKIAKGALDIANSLNNAELIKAMVELKNAATDLLVENQQLKKRIEALEEEKENPLAYIDGLYYEADDKDRKVPFCPACFDVNKWRVHLIPHSLKCPKCGTGYAEFTSDIRTSRRHTAEDVLRGY